MAVVVCEICGKTDSKYCCPGCDRRTCSLKCVKEHKEKFGCDGLKGIPTAPDASGEGTEKYNEELFVKDYNFLESVCTYTGRLEHSEKPDGSDSRRLKVLEFKRIQKVGKLAELRMIPTTFSRSKLNRTHLIKSEDREKEKEPEVQEKDTEDQESDIQEKESENHNNEPEKKSSRLARIAWTLDFVEYPSCKLIETKQEIPDDTRISDLIPSNCKRIFLKNETRIRDKEVEKWKEISEKETRTIAQILVGARCFEYPIFGLEF